MRGLFIKYFGRFLALLGCSTMVAACYGVPMDMETNWVKGLVKDAETGKPIKGIRVAITPGVSSGSTTGVQGIETIGEGVVEYTTPEGLFEASVSSYRTPDAFHVRCVDTDGELNGSYQAAAEFIILEKAEGFEIEMVPSDK